MKPQKPAEGILKTHDWGDSKFYEVPCHCGCESSHEVNVEADVTGIWVRTYTKEKTNYWSERFSARNDIENSFLQWCNWFLADVINSLCRKVSLTWKLWTKGYVEYQSDIAMTKQQALNYAEILKSAIKDVENFKTESRTAK